MTKTEIVHSLAQARVVEDITVRVAKASALTPELQDLAQIVYVALLSMDDDKLADLYESGQVNYFIVGIVRKQYWSQTSPFFHKFREFSKRNVAAGRRDADRLLVNIAGGA